MTEDFIFTQTFFNYIDEIQDDILHLAEILL